MRRSEKLLSEIADISEVMNRGEVIRIAMIHDGKPYLVPMNFGYSEGVIYLHCAREGKKIDALRANPDVCFEVTSKAEIVKKEVSCGWTCRFSSVIGTGRVSFVEDRAEKLDGLSLIMEHYGSHDHSFSDAAVEKTLVLRIDIESISGKTSPAPATTR
jgi:nitroimidazol reductase NimA-like FMN-containing flavoprotein (pyridoxamine 5'-phosphate oxidase superfamily)